jgi:hypothetical protein
MRGARRLRFLRQGALSRHAEALAQALPQFAAHARVAVDTEADSLHCYFEKLCLIQASVPGYDCLIDPLAGFPLEPFFAALAGKEIILHGADYDLRLMRRVGYSGPERIFDTNDRCAALRHPGVQPRSVDRAPLWREGHQGFTKSQLGKASAFATDGGLCGE